MTLVLDAPMLSVDLQHLGGASLAAMAKEKMATRE
jgi:hypothetical protein